MSFRQKVILSEIDQKDRRKLLFALEQLEAFRLFQFFERLIHPIRMAAFILGHIQPFQRLLALAGFPVMVGQDRVEPWRVVAFFQGFL